MRSIKILHFHMHRSWNTYLIFNKKKLWRKIIYIPRIIFFPRNIFCSEINSKINLQTCNILLRPYTLQYKRASFQQPYVPFFIQPSWYVSSLLISCVLHRVSPSPRSLPSYSSIVLRFSFLRNHPCRYTRYAYILQLVVKYSVPCCLPFPSLRDDHHPLWVWTLSRPLSRS